MAKVFDTHKTRMIGPPCGDETMTMTWLSRFHTVPELNGQTDRQTDGQNSYINTARECADVRY